MADDLPRLAAILAGGLGTRLRPVHEGPKVLVPVAGRPFLAHLLDQLDEAGIREVVLLTGYGADQVRSALGDSYRRMRLTFSEEPRPLGTGGAARLALDRIGEPEFLLLNGDSYCEVDLAAFAGWHVRQGAEASLVLTQVSDTSRYGRVRRKGDRIDRFEEKTDSQGPGWINAGIYLLRRALLEQVPRNEARSLERELLPGWVAANRVAGYAVPGRFLDIGTPESYASAERFFGRTGAAALMNRGIRRTWH